MGVDATHTRGTNTVGSTGLLGTPAQATGINVEKLDYPSNTLYTKANDAIAHGYSL